MLGSMPRSVPLGALVLAVLLLAGTGCGTASAPSPPAGVDGLTIPTPTPDPADFVGAVDNPWFPLTVGRRWVYEVSDTAGEHRLVVTASAGPVVAGVPTTARVASEQGRTITDWYAQDTDGNVWWFGREGEWRAGSDGAEAGIAMLATPRVGDGYRMAYDAGVVEDRATITSLDGEVTVPADTYTDVVVTDVESPVPAPREHEASYAEDVGLVEDESSGGEYRVLRLLRSVG